MIGLAKKTLEDIPLDKNVLTHTLVWKNSNFFFKTKLTWS